VDISETKFKGRRHQRERLPEDQAAALQFEQDVQQAQLAKTQALSDLRQLLGYESVPPTTT
jgi:hypothetical protein